jgi:hypothetical protein
MPVLPLEPFVFPNELFTASSDAPSENDRWWALYTRPRAEKTLARRLLARNVNFFLPLYKRQYRCSGRLIKGYLPLFQGYLFLRGDDRARIHALETNLVVRSICVEDQNQLEADLAQVYRLMESGFALNPEDRLPPGTLVQITAGPLAGVQGKVLDRSKKSRVFVEVKFLQSAVSVEVDDWMIELAKAQTVSVG